MYTVSFKLILGQAFLWRQQPGNSREVKRREERRQRYPSSRHWSLYRARYRRSESRKYAEKQWGKKILICFPLKHKEKTLLLFPLQDGNTRNPRAYRTAKLVADRGLPGFFLVRRCTRKKMCEHCFIPKSFRLSCSSTSPSVSRTT